MRLIDADELIKSIENTFDMQDDLHGVMPCHLIGMIYEQLENNSPVKHGHWIIKDAVTEDGYKTQYTRCSECNHAGVRSWIACPYCGADMRGNNENH